MGQTLWQPLWLEVGDTPAAATLTGRPGAEQGVVVVPPLGYDYWTSFAFLRDLAWGCAEAGMAALRLDLPGTGDSGGEAGDLDLEQVAPAALRAAVAELRRRGCSSVSLLGLRTGATLALLRAAELGADAVVAVAPVASGKRYVRELALLGSRVPDPGEGPSLPGTLVSGGVPFPDRVLDGLRGLDLTGIGAAPAPRVLLVEQSGAKGELADRLAQLGSAVTRSESEGLHGVLGVTTEKSSVPAETVAECVAWLRGAGRVPNPAGAARQSSDGPPHRLVWRGGEVAERSMVLPGTALTAVQAEPVAGPHRDTAVVFLNSGAEHHVGPGRAWVEYARHLSSRGFTSYRMDFRGWGESVLDRPVPGRPYAASAVQDVRAAAVSLRELGHGRVAVVGLCSSAWVALQAAQSGCVDGVYALNPQLYWLPGDPDDMTVDEATLWRAAETRRVERGSRLGLWTALDVLGVRPPGGRLLDRLARTGTTVRLVFAGGDLGHRYLLARMARRLSSLTRAGRLTCATIDDIDHQMHREWLRHRVARDVEAWLGELEGASDGRRRPAEPGDLGAVRR